MENELANYAEPTITSLVEKAKDFKPRLEERKSQKMAEAEKQSRSGPEIDPTEDRKLNDEKEHEEE